jgi:hypothetical protein
MPTTGPYNLWIPDNNTPLKPLANPFTQLATSVSNALVAIDGGVARPVTSVAARDALFPAPAQGNSVYRLDLGFAERYYALFNAGTNPGGATPAGWYPDRGFRDMLTAVVNNGPMNAGDTLYTKAYPALPFQTSVLFDFTGSVYVTNTGSRHFSFAATGAGVVKLSDPPGVGVHIISGQEQSVPFKARISIPAGIASTITMSFRGSSNQSYARGTVSFLREAL